MYVCMYVCDKNFVNFLKIGAYNFNFNYQSNVEGHLPIDALGAPFWALRPTWESLSNGEGPTSIDALGAPFWTLLVPGLVQKLILC